MVSRPGVDNASVSQVGRIKRKTSDVCADFHTSSAPFCPIRALYVMYFSVVRHDSSRFAESTTIDIRQQPVLYPPNEDTSCKYHTLSRRKSLKAPAFHLHNVQTLLPTSFVNESTRQHSGTLTGREACDSHWRLQRLLSPVKSH